MVQCGVMHLFQPVNLTSQAKTIYQQRERNDIPEQLQKSAFSDNKADFKANQRGESMTQENKNTKNNPV